MGLEAAEIGEAIGGLAGVIALAWNVVDAVRRRRQARAPQLRALMDQTVDRMSEMVAKLCIVCRAARRHLKELIMQLINGQAYRMTTSWSSLALDVRDSSTDNDAPVVQNPVNAPNMSQGWVAYEHPNNQQPGTGQRQQR